jgi:hypothetical protein
MGGASVDLVPASYERGTDSSYIPQRVGFRTPTCVPGIAGTLVWPHPWFAVVDEVVDS